MKNQITQPLTSILRQNLNQKKSLIYLKYSKKIIVALPFRICSTFTMTLRIRTIFFQSNFISKFLHIYTAKILFKFQSFCCLLRMKTLLLTLDSIHKAVLPLAFTHFRPHCSFLTIIGVKNRKVFKHLSRALLLFISNYHTKHFYE